MAAGLPTGPPSFRPQAGARGGGRPPARRRPVLVYLIVLEPLVVALWVGIVTGYASRSMAVGALAALAAITVLYCWRQLYQPRRRPPGF